MTLLLPARDLVHRRDLHDGWTVRAAAGPVPDDMAGAIVPAVVPGVVHLDLLAAGLIPDPYLDDNEARLAWIGLVDWTYETTFDLARADLDAADRHDLVLDGLDTVATVTLNGVVVLDVANQHRSHRVDATAIVREGSNALEVAFRSPVRYANAQSLQLGTRPRPYPLPYDAIRKSACSFGWDWGIATFASGIWRAVRLESWSCARLAEVLVHATPEGDGGRVEATVQVERLGDDELEVELTAAGASHVVVLAPGDDRATVAVALDEVERWWPVGHGEQPLTDVAVRLRRRGSDDVLDATTRRVGFRTVRWDTTPDADGTPFQLVVNDRPIFVKGVNWIPDDAFPSRVDRARYADRLRQAAAANLNLVRVWGGGIYESDDFYDVCDELGLLTWQDFLFACAAYSEDEPLRSEVEAEAREQVARLGHRTSLVLLTGNNENLWGYEDWGWQLRLDGKSWGAGYYHELLPSIVDELAPHVPYAPGSPFSPHGEHPNAERHGSMHLWEQWNRLDWPTYREQTPRFVAEFGWQGPPTWTTLTRSIGDDPLTPESPGMLVHQKAAEGNAKLATGLIPHYRMPEEMERWHWAMQLNQANAVTCALEWFRSHAPTTAGAVVWQLNDCWPVTSWSAIDGDGREKPLLHAIRSAFAPRVLTIQPRDGGLVATIVNDEPEAWEGAIVVQRRSFAGAVLATAEVQASVEAWGATTVPIPPGIGEAGDAASELLVAEAAGVRGLWFLAEPRDSALAAPMLDVTVAADGDGFAVTVAASTLVRDLTLLADRIHPDARVDRGLVTLLPGESTTFRVTGVDRLEAADVAEAGVLRSGNELVAS